VPRCRGRVVTGMGRNRASGFGARERIEPSARNERPARTLHRTGAPSIAPMHRSLEPETPRNCSPPSLSKIRLAGAPPAILKTPLARTLTPANTPDKARQKPSSEGPIHGRADLRPARRRAADRCRHRQAGGGSQGQRRPVAGSARERSQAERRRPQPPPRPAGAGRLLVRLPTHGQRPPPGGYGRDRAVATDRADAADNPEPRPPRRRGHGGNVASQAGAADRAAPRRRTASPMPSCSRPVATTSPATSSASSSTSTTGVIQA
jgi:hypothetical protein